ncbi:iron complex transport system ATP-binding protein [Methylovirgula ligni]|uniref:Iron complex transport system ATP-binding protein n=2 Tax=Methylovirgula ligni TaxID=569860 RepID=A0A3D9YX26_9HYPH|nr:iron complex transport system ATP-binding protein [Methylovirgula ligni]
MEAHDIGFWYRPGQWLFRHVSLSFAPGTITALLGVNGSGKTTFLRSLCGVIHPKEGHFVRSGVIGYVPQALYAEHAYSALDMVLLGRSRYLGRFGAPGHSDMERALACLDDVGLAGLAHARYDQLSGGQRQLVLLARALATDCVALVLDEPASALDLANAGLMLKLLSRLAAERGLTVLFTTHQPDHALSVADKALLFLGDGFHTFGPVQETLSEANLSKLYGVPVKRLAVTDHDRIFEAAIPLYRIDR